MFLEETAFIQSASGSEDAADICSNHILQGLSCRVRYRAAPSGREVNAPWQREVNSVTLHLPLGEVFV